MAKAPARKPKAAPRRASTGRAAPPDTVTELARRLTLALEQKQALRERAGDLFSLIIRMERADAVRLPFPRYRETMDALLEVLRATR